MRKVAVVALFICVVCVPHAYGQGRSDRAVTAREGSGSDLRPRRSVTAFHGRVERVDIVGRTLSVRGGGGQVTFDTTDQILSGYRDLSEIKVGDSVAVEYGRTGIRIARTGGGRTPPPPRVDADRALKATRTGINAGIERQVKQSKGLQRKRLRGDAQSFDEADINGDGMLSPVELCVVIKGLTIEKFRQYDRNKNGRIDRSEFVDALRQEKREGDR